MEVITPPVIGHLTWYGAVCSPACFCEHRVAKQEIPNYQPLQNLTYQIDSLENDMNRDFCQSRLFNTQKFVLSTSQALKLKNFKYGW